MPSQLWVSRLSVRSFRCLASVDLAFEAGTTVLVGENNAGKTSVLMALATALGRRRASTDDMHRANNGSTPTEVVIDVFLSPPVGQSAFSDEIAQRLEGGVQREPGTNEEVVGIRTVLKRSGEGTLLSESRHFLQPTSQGWLASPSQSPSGRVLGLVEAQVLEASRDLFADMGLQTSSWGRVLSNLKIPELPDTTPGNPDPRSNKGIELALRTIAQQVRDASPVLSQLHTDLSGLSRTQAMVKGVELIPLPDRVEELGRTMEIILHHRESAGLPLRFSGSGSRSLAALFVFKTMCAINIGADQGTAPHLVTLLEEPEAHLHPQSITALTRTIDELPGQRIVSTHSASYVAEIPIASVRLLRRDGATIKVTQLSKSRPKEIEHFRRYFGRPFGELFFARLAILGDGITEKNALPVLVGMALGVDPAALGVVFVDCKSNEDVSVNKLLAALSDLEIPWLYLADNDKEGFARLQRTVDPATGIPLTVEHPSVATLTNTKQIEQMLIDGGYGPEITAVAAENGEIARDDGERLKFLKSHKAWAVEAVAVAAKNAGKPSPVHLNDLLEKVRVQLHMTP